MIILSQILAEVLDTFYTLQAMATVTAAGAQGTHLVLQLAKPVQLKLKDWFTALPTCLRMDSSSSSTASPNSKLSSTGFLHLAYFATEITLHRRIIRSLTSSPTSPTSPSSKPALDPYILHICRSAAKTRLISAMDFVNRLTSSHLRAFWYFASKTNFALIGTFGSLLWATAPGREEADWYRRRLGEYRWTLGVSCKGTNSEGGNGRLTEFAMGMLDTSTGLLKALPEKPALSRVGSESEGFGNGANVGRRQRSIAEGYGFGGYGGGGFGIGAPRGEGSVGGEGDESMGMRSGLASPSTSVSSSGGEAYMPPRIGYGVTGGDEAY
jgi:hypothetical protein